MFTNFLIHVYYKGHQICDQSSVTGEFSRKRINFPKSQKKSKFQTS